MTDDLRLMMQHVHTCLPARDRCLEDPVRMGEERGLPDVVILVECESEEDPFPFKAPSQGQHR